MRRCSRRIFGPVLPVVTYRAFEDALWYVRSRPKPLALYVFSRKGSTVDATLAETTSGGVCVNNTLLHLANPGLPFGGIGPSGMGNYHGRAGFRTFSHERAVASAAGKPHVPLARPALRRPDEPDRGPAGAMAGVTGPRRARSPEDKQQRRQDILDRAWELFQTRAWAELTMSDVAEASGLSKAAIYRYFETKESLFLEVEEARLGGWLHGLGAELDRLPRPASPDVVGTLIADSLVARPGLPRLLALLHVSLEQNVPFDAALAFKRALHEWLVRLGGRLEAALVSLPKGRGFGPSIVNCESRDNFC